MNFIMEKFGEGKALVSILASLNGTEQPEVATQRLSKSPQRLCNQRLARTWEKNRQLERPPEYSENLIHY